MQRSWIMMWHNSPSVTRHMNRRTQSNYNLFFPLCNTNKSLCNLLWSAEHLFTSEWRPLNEMETARFTLSIINQCSSGFTDTWSKWDDLRWEGSKLKEKTQTKALTHAIIGTKVLVFIWNKKFTSVDTLFFLFVWLLFLQ